MNLKRLVLCLLSLIGLWGTQVFTTRVLRRRQDAAQDLLQGRRMERRRHLLPVFIRYVFTQFFSGKF